MIWRPPECTWLILMLILIGKILFCFLFPCRAAQVYDAHFSKNLRFDGQHWRVPVPLLLAPLMRRSTSDLIQSITGSSKKEQHSPNSVSLTAEHLPEEEPELPVKESIPPEYDEIDQIYDYIRGFAPLPKTATTNNSSSGYEKGTNKESGRNNQLHHRNNLYNRVLGGGGGKPVPPPVETIPKTDGQHHSVTITVNNKPTTAGSPSPVAKPRMYRQRSAMQPTTTPSSGNRLYSKNPAAFHHHQRIISPAESKQSLTPSPLFNIRYKSMTNLLAASAADSDTLGSSQSGGRCSGGSAGSAAVRTAYLRQSSAPSQKMQPQLSSSSRPHRLFQLHRPKSLTDLLWGGRSSSERPVKIQLHPTVVADVLPAASSQNNRRRHSGTNLLLNGHSSNHHHGSKKHHHHHTTIFYHL